MNLKAFTSILAAGAVLAVAIPAANASGNLIPRDPGTNVDRVVLRVVPSAVTAKKNAAQIKRLAAKNKALTAQNKALARKITALDAWISSLIRERSQPSGGSSTGGGGTVVFPDQRHQECIDFGTNCTDEELCQYWGYSCDPAPQTGAATQEPAVESAPLADELPSIDSSDLPPEVTGEVEFDYSVYDWEG